MATACSSSSPARSRSTGCRTRKRRGRPGPSRRTPGRCLSPCTGATSSTASTSAATTADTTGSSPPRSEARGVDFRAIRFPGLISAFTTPSGGTSDYAPEMLHAAAQGRPYACFVREDTRIPFMAMPDAVDALLALADAPAERLASPVYNVTAFNPSAGELADLVRSAFPGAAITFAPDRRRQRIVDSWPEDVDDARARRDWGFRPQVRPRSCAARIPRAEHPAALRGSMTWTARRDSGFRPSSTRSRPRG